MPAIPDTVADDTPIVTNPVIEKTQEELDQEVLDEFLRGLNRAERVHREMCARYARCDKAYEAVSTRENPKENEIQWESNLRPPYALQIVETLTSNFVQEDLTVDILPETPDDEQGAEANTQVLQSQLRKDRFNEKQYLFAKQFCIRGLSVAKIPWDQRLLVQYQIDTIEEVDEETGETITREESTEKAKVIKDQPTFVVVDLYDFMWDPGATSMDDAREVYHRTWETKESLQAMATPGPNGEPPVYKNIDSIKGKNNRQRYDTNRTSYDGSQETDMSDRVEVIERWRRNRLTVIANRGTVIRDEAMPYNHGKLPFVVASPMPGMFRFDGKSIVEIIDDLQRMIWEFRNQSIDNAKLINNAIVLFRTGLQDMEKYQAFPGAKWPVDDPSSVAFLRPELSILESAAMMENRAQEDINNITGAVPYLAGTMATGQGTATEANIISNMAQKRIALMKQQITYAFADAFEQMVALNKQLISRPLAIRLAGPGNTYNWEIVTPNDLAGDFEFYARPVSESLNREQMRAEALSIAQFWLSNAPIVAGASGNQITVNIREALMPVCKAFGLNIDKLLSTNTPVAGQAQPSTGQLEAGTPSPDGASNGEAPVSSAPDLASILGGAM